MKWNEIDLQVDKVDGGKDKAIDSNEVVGEESDKKTCEILKCRTPCECDEVIKNDYLQIEA